MILIPPTRTVVHDASKRLEVEQVEKGDGSILYEVNLKFEVHMTPEGKVAAMGKDL